MTAALAGVIGLSATGALSLSVGLLALLVGLWLSDLVSVDDLRRRFPFDIWILVASALVLLSHWWIQHLSVRVWHGSCRCWLTNPLIALIIIFS